jgi:hypothetical protein
MKTITTTHGNPGPMDTMPGEAEQVPLEMSHATVSLSAEDRLAAIVAIIRKARRLSDDNALLLPDEVEKVYALAMGSAEP